MGGRGPARWGEHDGLAEAGPRGWVPPYGLTRCPPLQKAWREFALVRSKSMHYQTKSMVREVNRLLRGSAALREMRDILAMRAKGEVWLVVERWRTHPRLKMWKRDKNRQEWEVRSKGTYRAEAQRRRQSIGSRQITREELTKPTTGGGAPDGGPVLRQSCPGPGGPEHTYAPVPLGLERCISAPQVLDASEPVHLGESYTEQQAALGGAPEMGRKGAGAAGRDGTDVEGRGMDS